VTTITTLNPTLAEQIKDLIRRERMEARDQRMKQAAARQGGLDTYIVKASETIAARSGTTPGSGQATIQDCGSGALADTYGQTQTAVSVTIHNSTDSAFASGDYLIVTQDRIAGKYWVATDGSGASVDPGVMMVKNNSGAAVSKFNILGIDDAVYSVATQLSSYQGLPPSMNGDYANDGSPGHWGRWCVLQEDIANGATGLARISGVTPVQLDTDSGRSGLPYADVNLQNDTTLAEESWFGSATILDAQWNTGNTARWAIVLMHGYVEPIYRATAQGTIASGSSGTARIVHGSFTGSARDVTAYNTWAEGTHDFSTNDELLIKFHRINNQWVIVNGEC